MKKIFVKVVLIIIVLFAYVYIKNLTKPKPEFYNILYITADSFKYSHLNCYGYKKRITSPTIDKLAKNGVLFEKFINPSGWTNENLVSIFSALESPIHKVVCRQRSIDDKWYLPLEILKDYGYLIPKLQGWQTDPNHDNLGFDEYKRMQPWEWLDKNHNKRFFLWYQFLFPHLPYNCDRMDTYTNLFLKKDMFKNKESEERIKNTVMKKSVILKGTIEFKPEDKEPIYALYDAEIKLLDDNIKKLLATLDKYNLRDNTIILLGADHGEELLEHGFIGHASTNHAGSLYDEIIHTPFIISFPKKLAKNKRIPYQVSGIDVMPTIFQLMNIKTPSYLRGKSLLPMIEGKENKDRLAFCETSRAGYGEPDPVNVTDYIRCVRDTKWKLIHYQYKENTAHFELYDLENDPKEKNNLINKKPEIAKKYKKILMNWLLECEQIYPQGKSKTRTFIEKIKKIFIKEKLDLTGVDIPPKWIFPKNNMTVDFKNINGKVALQWTGKENIPYILEYQVGTGDYYIDGHLNIKGNKKVFGPFSENYWKTFLIPRNPYKIRVAVKQKPYKFSKWIKFTVK